jgi:hypothetical protein
LRSASSSIKGGAWFLSTPRGLGDFKTLFDRGQDPRQTDWVSWQIPTASNPYIDPAEITPLGRWDGSTVSYELEDVTRLDFGGGYEEALALVGCSHAAEINADR